VEKTETGFGLKNTNTEPGFGLKKIKTEPTLEFLYRRITNLQTILIYVLMFFVISDRIEEMGRDR